MAARPKARGFLSLPEAQGLFGPIRPNGRRPEQIEGWLTCMLLQIPQKRWMVSISVKIHQKMDDDWGYLHCWKPPYWHIYGKRFKYNSSYTSTVAEIFKGFPGFPGFPCPDTENGGGDMKHHSRPIDPWELLDGGASQASSAFQPFPLQAWDGWAWVLNPLVYWNPQ